MASKQQILIIITKILIFLTGVCLIAISISDFAKSSQSDENMEVMDAIWHIYWML